MRSTGTYPKREQASEQLDTNWQCSKPAAETDSRLSPSAHLKKVVDDLHQARLVFLAQVDVVEASRATWLGGAILDEKGGQVHALGSDVIDAHS